MSVTPRERRNIAVETINWLLSEMTKSSYEYNGKPIYDGLTRDHIDYVVQVMADDPAPLSTERTDQ